MKWILHVIIKNYLYGLINYEALINIFSTDNSRSINWKEGRRIIEFGIIAKQLYRGCLSSHQPLHLINCIDKQHFRLGSLISMRNTLKQASKNGRKPYLFPQNKIWFMQ